jgi:heme/copper-type cytochrome/quinol oxidase subunit 3
MLRNTYIDVSELPGSAFDSQSPVWWGNTLLMLIETMTLALLIVSYFYLSQNFEFWPPPSVSQLPPIHDPDPDLAIGSWLVGLLAIATIPMIWADRGAHNMQRFPVLAGTSLGALAGVIAIVLRIFEFGAVKVRWDENAYGSLVWALLFIHLLYLIVEVGEIVLNVLWIAMHGMDEKHAVDVTLSTGFWYWTAATAVVIYGVIYWAPRLM